ncbi:mitogen-activated protein kinase organizer 1 [Phyllosticta capitalensis]|uniref:WD40-repeat-containing domain protein n=1 Tax=Phyllosticta capitalensis TaxID=121624 RepID=UPI003132119D
MTAPFPTQQIARLSGHNGPVHALTYSAGLGQYILTGSSDRSIRLFNATKASLVQSYTGHGYEVLDISVTEDNARFASCGGDKTVFVWDVATAKTVRRLAGHVGRVNGVAWGAAGDVVVSGSFDATVKLWDLKSQSTKPLMSLEEARDSVSCVAVVEHQVFAGSVDGRIRTYDIRMGMVYEDVVGHPITSLTPTKLADSVLVSSLDSTLRLMDLANGKLLQAFKSPSYTNTAYRIRSTLANKDATALSGSEDGTVVAWDVVSGEVIHTLQQQQQDPNPPQGAGTPKKNVVSAVAWCPGRRKEFASAGGNDEVVLWGVPE